MRKLAIVSLLVLALILVGCSEHSNKIPRHKYAVGDVIAWSGGEWEKLNEFEGRVLGQIVKFEDGRYLIKLHPYYTAPTPIEPNPPKYEWYSADYIDRNTELWDKQVDWEATLSLIHI